MTAQPRCPRVVQIVGYKKTGKTTLLCRLIERFAAEGLRVGVAKHDGHEFEPDVPDTDTWLLRRSGAVMTAIASDARTAFFENRGAPLDELVSRMAASDLVLAEGWKRERYPKLALVHSDADLPLLASLDALAGVVSWNPALRRAWASSQAALEYAALPIFDYEDIAGIAAFILRLAQGD
ncbi:molybdopterin-guanine dinucleotide biosynthesis protein B [Paenibacillus sp.]|uniref:molybdopterin-guanine dinucleotide biosynthesis protein B n=1 Tax=Paenibacillus sp. TaxID=58172 RepID=UPI002D62C24D|nr:molybdopterin-guanine dinucleotide biosynthesis protein B [Paenibacillus sp.]HZG55949.1 molybdopterin-guanine dinucleotide biosynthesis protein B [Paenibacillus sp.]